MNPTLAPVESPSAGSADFGGYARRINYVASQVNDARDKLEDFAHARDSLRKVKRELELCLIDLDLLVEQNITDETRVIQ